MTRSISPGPRTRARCFRRPTFRASLALVATLATLAAPAAQAQTITILDGDGRISQTRAFTRSGPHATRWSAPAAEANTADHEGRGADIFEDGGLGAIAFAVKAGIDGRATVAFQDVGDTKAFAGFSINGQAVEIPAPRANGGIFRAILDFGAAGWHQLVAVTTLAANAGPKLDGFGARRCAR